MLLAVLGPLLRVKPGDCRALPDWKFPAPVAVGLIGPPRRGPIVVGKLEGFTALATRLNAPRHCKTCAGSLDSYRSTVRKRSCEGMFSGALSHARRKCEMFSICMNGMGDFLNLTPGLGTARLANLHSCQYRMAGLGGGADAHTCIAQFRPSTRPEGLRKAAVL